MSTLTNIYLENPGGHGPCSGVEPHRSHDAKGSEIFRTAFPLILRLDSSLIRKREWQSSSPQLIAMHVPHFFYCASARCTTT